MNNKKRGTIGIFDSGFGGLDIMKEIVKELPNYNYIYLGDTARVPYGDRPKEVVYKFTKQAVVFLFSKNCDLVILACNTASSDALRKIQQKSLPKKYPGKKVLGVIIPTVEYAVLRTKNKKIGVIATKRTVMSKAFVKEFSKIDGEIKVFQNACPLLVPIIESGEHNSEKVDKILKKYLNPLVAKRIDSLILGCTHYGILKNKINKIIGKKVEIIPESKVIAKKLKEYLMKHPEIEKKLVKKAQYTFYSTGEIKKFEKLGSQFFGRKIRIKKAKISK